MSEQEKKLPEEETAETAVPEQAEPAGPEASAQEPEETPETFAVTREQMEAMETLAGQLTALNDQYLRLAAGYDNHRQRTPKEKENPPPGSAGSPLCEGGLLERNRRQR